MRCYTNQHQFYCGIDFHARRMSGCIVGHDGELRVHRNMTAAPEPFLKAIAPDRDNLVVAVACLFPWDWLAELWAHEGMPFVRGHALSMKAIHGGRLPQAAVSPAARRATRDLLRRRAHLMRTRAARLAPVHNTKSP